MLCAVVCPNDAFHENFKPEGKIDLAEFPTIGQFYKIDYDKCTVDRTKEICNICLKARERNNIKLYNKIKDECPASCFEITSPIQGEVIIKKNMLHKCSPENCKACINICPVESFFIPESAEDVVKYGKIACNEEQCFYCGACENSCPDDLIKVERKSIEIMNPKKVGNYPWIEGWIQNINEILRKRIIKGKHQADIPLILQDVKILSENLEESVPQLSEDEKQQLSELNEKIQGFLKKTKVRYWINDKKVDKVIEELRKTLSKH
jgi:4Fe-4S ferredoxin